MSGFTREKAVRLLGLLKEEADIFGQMLKLTEEQAGLIDADDIEAFEKSLDQRQEHIEKINGLHQESEALMQSYVAYTNARGGKPISEIETASGKLRDLITRCIEKNEKNTGAAKEKSQGYSERIDKLSLNRKTLGSYIQNMSNDPEIFDKTT